MNREFKFRVFHTIDNKMHYDKMDNYLYIGMDGDNSVWRRSNCQVMRWTGRRDKNNKDIYENDIVRFDNTVIHGRKGIAQIEWLDDFTVQDNPGWSMFNNGWLSRETFLGCEVIGNSFENPNWKEEFNE